MGNYPLGITLRGLPHLPLTCGGSYDSSDRKSRDSIGAKLYVVLSGSTSRGRFLGGLWRRRRLPLSDIEYNYQERKPSRWREARGKQRLNFYKYCFVKLPIRLQTTFGGFQGGLETEEHCLSFHKKGLVFTDQSLGKPAEEANKQQPRDHFTETAVVPFFKAFLS